MTGPTGAVVHGGQPEPEELAAVLAAIEVAWPRPVVAAAAPADQDTARWRFSGRWWTKPVPIRRERP